MHTTNRAARIIAVLILIQIIGGGLVNFSMEAPLFGTPGFLEAAAAHGQQIGVAAVLSLAIEALWVAIAITAYPLIAPRSQALALWFFALAVVVLTIAVVENAAVMSMVSVSEAYAKAGDAGREVLQTVRIIAASARNWAHFLARAMDGCTILVFYAALYRFALVPRVLAGFGALTALSMIIGVSMPLFGHEVIFPMLAPLGLSQLALVVWLLLKGFADHPAPVRNQTAPDG